MVYDSTQPTNTTKIRNLGVVIRPNWIAIEDGDPTFKPKSINYNNRTPLGVPNDPAAVANAYVMYCKQDSAGSPQMFGIDQNSRISQLTAAITPQKAPFGFTWLPGGLMIQWGQTAAIASNADDNVLFGSWFAANAYSVQITGRHNGGALVTGNVHTLTQAGFKLRNTSSVARDFYWIAIGPQV